MARTHEIERSANSAAAALEPQRAGTGSYPAASGWIIGIFFFSFLSRLGIVIQRVPPLLWSCAGWSLWHAFTHAGWPTAKCPDYATAAAAAAPRDSQLGRAVAGVVQ